MAVLSISLPGVSCDLDQSDGISRCAVLIPALKPDGSLVSMVRALAERGYGAVIVVDDGSGAESVAVFEEIRGIGQVHLLRHAINMGKGRALKAGFNYFLSELSLEAVITADADGQHAVEDIERVAKVVCDSEAGVALGVRTFAMDVPLRSKVGNLLTRNIFRVLTGAKLKDTQTGLRAFSREVLPDLPGLKGERYEYEMNVLAHLCRKGKSPMEIPIRTIYIDRNHSSHFDPLRDSLRIYGVLARIFLSLMRFWSH